VVIPAHETKLYLKRAAQEAGALTSRTGSHLSHQDEVRPLHISTLVRWVTKGIGGVKLEAEKCGGRWVTSREALQRFVARLTPCVVAPSNQSPPDARRHADQVAAEKLSRRGF